MQTRGKLWKIEDSPWTTNRAQFGLTQLVHFDDRNTVACSADGGRAASVLRFQGFEDDEVNPFNTFDTMTGARTRLTWEQKQRVLQEWKRRDAEGITRRNTVACRADTGRLFHSIFIYFS